MKKTKPKTKRKELSKGNALAVIIIAAVVLLGVFLIVTANLRAERERNYEMADLYAMRNAELGVQMMFKEDKPDQEQEFWYDPNTYELIPASEAMPDAAGMGTGRSGGGIAQFQRETGMDYPYDETVDYRDKVIHVTVRPDLSVDIDWVTKG